MCLAVPSYTSDQTSVIPGVTKSLGYCLKVSAVLPLWQVRAGDCYMCLSSPSNTPKITKCLSIESQEYCLKSYLPVNWVVSQALMLS